jgi:hypothetical protein
MHRPLAVNPLPARLARLPDRAWLAGAPPLGALSSLGFEPWALAPLAFAALVALMTALIARPVRAAAFAFLFFAAHFIVSLAWIATAFTSQSKMPAAFGWPAAGPNPARSRAAVRRPVRRHGGAARPVADRLCLESARRDAACQR